MTTLRIYDLKDHHLALDLKDLLRLLAPHALEAHWTISTVKLCEAEEEWFEATGKGGERLAQLAQEHGQLSGSDLAALAENTRQVIWGEFIGATAAQEDKPWVIIRAIDSSFYEIVSDDAAVLNKMTSSYQNVQMVETLATP